MDRGNEAVWIVVIVSAVLCVPVLACGGCLVVGMVASVGTEQSATEAAQATESSVQYVERTGELSGKLEQRLGIAARDGMGVLIVTRTGDYVEVELASEEVLFPDDVDSAGMQLSVTFRFDVQEEPVQSMWHMAAMKYKNAWYLGPTEPFVRDLFRAESLSLRADKRGTVFRFDLSRVAEYQQAFRGSHD